MLTIKTINFFRINQKKKIQFNVNFDVLITAVYNIFRIYNILSFPGKTFEKK